jgi:UPF0271 protein
MKLVIDSSAIFSGKYLGSDNELYTTPGVLSEINPGGRVRKQLEYLLAAGLNVQIPSKDNLTAINTVAEKTGDIGRLSKADIELLALARELGAVLLSDDYSIQNVAIESGIKYEPVAQTGISKVFTWEYKCKGCGMHFQDKLKDCPVCGAGLKPVRKNA